MKAINQFINEAKRLSSYSNYELACEFWDEWSGMYNGTGGTSGNSRAQRLEDEMYKRYTGKKDFFGISWITSVDDFMRKNLKLDYDGKRRIDIMNWAKTNKDIAHDIIKQNIDAIYNTEIESVKDIKYSK